MAHSKGVSLGILILLFMLGVFLIGFLPVIILVVRVKSSFPWYFRSKVQSFVHFVLVIIAAYFGYEYGWSIVSSNFISAADGFGSDRSGFLFLVGIVLPGFYCFIANAVLFTLGKFYYNIYTK